MKPNILAKETTYDLKDYLCEILEQLSKLEVISEMTFLVRSYLTL